ncbi:MAG: tRNA (adenosine(37)-N6)-threonylcarbamoyltransferase complex transferase subunit TsaD [Coriobacteriia bacterium]
MSVTLRLMRRSDISAVIAIERASFSDPWQPGIFADELRAPGRIYLVAEDDRGTLIGYLGMMVIADEAHVMNIAVRGDRRREGVGRLLLEMGLHLARKVGAERVTLEVRPSNSAAIGLYESEGLVQVGLRPGYYSDSGKSDSGEPAVIMWGEIPADLGEPEVELEGHHRPPVNTLILAIETSCDETAAAVIRGSRDVLGSVVASQIDFHARFGGVVPEIASRKHTEAIVGVVDDALRQAGEALGLAAPHGLGAAALGFEDLDAIAVTHGPGLIGALVVGVAYAKGLAMATGLPLVGVNHLEGHIFANVLADPEVKPPLVALVVSGGHTSLVHMPEWGRYRTLGETLDDAAGEAFDKVAKVLGLGYPGGPVLSRLAETGDPSAIDFPRAMMRSGDYSFSLSGLKTAVINHIRHEREAGRELNLPDLAASFQQAIIDVQVAKAVRAIEETGAKSFCLAGGVAANPALRTALVGAIEPLGVHVSVPPLGLCTDNAAMIAAAAHFRFLRGEHLSLDAEPMASLPLDAE